MRVLVTLVYHLLMNNFTDVYGRVYVRMPGISHLGDDYCELCGAHQTNILTPYFLRIEDGTVLCLDCVHVE